VTPPVRALAPSAVADDTRSVRGFAVPIRRLFAILRVMTSCRGPPTVTAALGSRCGVTPPVRALAPSAVAGAHQRTRACSFALVLMKFDDDIDCC